MRKRKTFLYLFTKPGLHTCINCKDQKKMSVNMFLNVFKLMIMMQRSRSVFLLIQQKCKFLDEKFLLRTVVPA